MFIQDFFAVQCYVSLLYINFQKNRQFLFISFDYRGMNFFLQQFIYLYFYVRKKGNYIDSRIEYLHEMIASIMVAPFTRALSSFSCEQYQCSCYCKWNNCKWHFANGLNIIHDTPLHRISRFIHLSISNVNFSLIMNNDTNFLFLLFFLYDQTLQFVLL